MILLPIKIVIWLAVVKLSINTGRWNIWLGLVTAGSFAFFDSLGYRWDWMQTLLFGTYWCIAAATLWGFGRFESMLARIVIMGLGSFLLIMGPFLIPYPLG